MPLRHMPHISDGYKMIRRTTAVLNTRYPWHTAAEKTLNCITSAELEGDD